MAKAVARTTQTPTGGDTTATSGDATGGDGGSADADGGDAKPRTTHWSNRPTSHAGGSHSPERVRLPEYSKNGSGSSQSNESSVDQGDPRRMAVTPMPKAVTVATPTPVIPRSATATRLPSRSEATRRPKVATPRRPAAMRPEATAATPMPLVAKPMAQNDALVKQTNESSSHPSGKSSGDPSDKGSAPGRAFELLAEQQIRPSTKATPEATGGNAAAKGGDGGNAESGNTQKFNGNAVRRIAAPGEPASGQYDQSRPSLRLRARQTR